MNPHWGHFEHQADIGIRGTGSTLSEAFAQAACAMMAVVTELSRVRPDVAIDIRCEEADPELLLVDWLNALVYEMATRRMLFSRFDVAVEQDRLTATAWGETMDLERHHPSVEIKGATYTELSVQHANNEWTAQCVVDV